MKRRAIGAGARQMGGAAIPYAMSFYAKGLEGYIDNPDAGWKGRGVWTPRGPISVMRAPF